MGQVRAGLELLQKALVHAERLPHPLSVAFKGCMRSLRAHTRDPETTRVHVDEIAALSDEQRLVFWSSQRGSCVAGSMP
jgi:hypothetical protein